ncbi:MAG: AmmeMemoRadiSam system protein B [Pelovirga sp.]
MIRQPAVAGLFYPAGAAALSRQVAGFLAGDTSPVDATAVILPHAGYDYSGAVVGAVLGRIRVPRRVILLGPNHYGRGAAVAVTGATVWQTPAGAVPVAVDLLEHLRTEAPELVVDERAHQQEHSLEVLLPFLRHCQPQLQIVPIALNHQLECADCVNLGHAIARAVSSWDEPVLLVASSDMNHFLPARENTRLDALALDAMTAFDPQRLYQVVEDHHISMCGVLPVVTVMTAARDLGAQACDLVRYTHSGEQSGDNSRVVGYAGMMIN